MDGQATIIDLTADEVLGDRDLTGMRVLVTGASAGIGVETCRVLAVRGAEVIGAIRDLNKGHAAAQSGAFGEAMSISFVEMDLSSLESVRRCADALIAQGQQLDAIICNAGIMAYPEGKTVDGFETQFGTNHLGHFVLVNKLAPLVRDQGRVVMLSSSAHRLADVDLDDPYFERTDYDPMVAYGRSKTANILFAVELDRRLRGRGIFATAVHPGVIYETQLTRHVPEMNVQAQALLTSDDTPDNCRRELRAKSIAQGAATTIWSGFAAPREEVRGRYCEDCHVAPIIDTDDVFDGGVRSYALDPQRAMALWTLSEKMVGETFAN